MNVFKSNRVFETKYSKTNGLQKTIDYKLNEQSTKYLSWNVQIETQPSKVSTCSFYYYLVSVELY